MNRIEDKRGSDFGPDNIVSVVWACESVRDAVASCVGGVSNKLSLGESHRGFGSVVTHVMDDSGKSCGVVIRVPHVDGKGRRVGDVLDSLLHAGVEDMKGLYVVNSELGEVYSLAVGECDLMSSDQALSLADQVQADVVLQVLVELPSGKTAMEHILERSGNVDWLSVYAQAGARLRKLHETPMEQGNYGNWLDKSLLHPVSGGERYDALVVLIGDDAEWFPSKSRQAIRAKMLGVVEIQRQKPNDLLRVHYDYWEGNWWVSDEGEVSTFDPALAYGVAGCDVAFAVGKQFIHYLVTGDADALGLVHAFVGSYGLESVRRHEEGMWNPFVYKLIVAAKHHGYDQQTQERLIVLADRLLEEKLSKPETEFSLEFVAESWRT